MGMAICIMPHHNCTVLLYYGMYDRVLSHQQNPYIIFKYIYLVPIKRFNPKDMFSKCLYCVVCPLICP